MQDKQEKFLILHYKLLSAGGYVSVSGEQVKMNLSDKVIYAHLKNRFEFFKGLGKEYFDTQQSIASVCNMDLKTVGNILRGFIDKGLTTIYKKPYGNFTKNVYTNVPHLKLWYKGEDVVDSTEGFDYGVPEDFVNAMPDVCYLGNWEEENDLSEYYEYSRSFSCE